MRARTFVATVLAGFVALAVSWAPPASANVFALDGKDPRVATPRTGDDRLYAPVGIIITGAPVVSSEDGKQSMRTRGSAFLVAPCYVLTNFHAVFGLAYNGPDPSHDYSAIFSVGADPDYMFHWTVRAKPVRWGAFNRRKEHDWALLKLDGCVGGEPDVGWLDVQAEPGPKMMGETVSLAGYPADKTGNALWLDANCKVEAMQPGTAKVLHECSVHGGASGGPLIERGKAGPAAVAIQCGELNAVDGLIERWDPHHANTAVTIAEVMRDPEVRSLIAADVAAFPGANPALSIPPGEAPAPSVEPIPPAVPDASGEAKESQTSIAGLL